MAAQETWTAQQYQEYAKTGKAPNGKSGKSKYNNKWVEYNGRKYQSQDEADYSKELDWRKKAGEIKWIKYQYPIELKDYSSVEEKTICIYKLDFFYMNDEGKKVLVEVKGMELPLWKTKWDIIKAQFHKIDADVLLLVKRKGKRFKVVETWTTEDSEK